MGWSVALALLLKLAFVDSRLTLHLDGFHRVPIERLRSIVDEKTGENKYADRNGLDSFAHFTCPSLPHFIALLCRPTALCIPQGASLVVVDSLSALINHALPKLPEPYSTRDAKGNKGTSAAVFLVGSLFHQN